MSKKDAVKVLKRRLAYIEARIAENYYSAGRSEHRVRAELSALKLAIDALEGAQ